MTLRQQTTLTASASFLDIPTSLERRLDQLDLERRQRIAELATVARERHDARSKRERTRLMDGGCDLATYRAAIADSAAQLARDLADAPPEIDHDLMQAHVEVQAADAAESWWRQELDAAARQQAAWVPATTPEASEEAGAHA